MTIEQIIEQFQENISKYNLPSKIELVLRGNLRQALTSRDNHLREVVGKKERHDAWANGFNVDMTNGYNMALDDILQTLKDTSK